MAATDRADEATFRAEVRGWLEDNLVGEFAALKGLGGPGREHEAHEERVVRALRDAGIAFEISNRYRPHPRIVRRAAEAGVRLSLGSDGHSREQVADVAHPLALARSLGVRDEDLYDPTRHGSRTGAFE